MRTVQDRYFITNVLFPMRSLHKLLHDGGAFPIYFDSDYSPLRDVLNDLCMKILHIFEQPEFAFTHGTQKRDAINGSDPAFHRIFSHAIKAKHGSVKNKNYSDTTLLLPCFAYVWEEEGQYDLGYVPLLAHGGSEHNLLEDLVYAVNELISLYGLGVAPVPSLWQPSKRRRFGNGHIAFQLQDEFNYFPEGLQSSANIRAVKLVGSDWIPFDPKEITFEVIAAASKNIY